MDYQRRRGGLNNEDITGATRRQTQGMVAGMTPRSKNDLQAYYEKYNINNLPSHQPKKLGPPEWHSSY
jgi:hypothetical protein